MALLLEWQRRINLIAPSTVPEVWERHVADSLQLLSLIPDGTTAIADLGSGAGFPGIVLACALEKPVHLFEANGKKCAFLREALRVTGRIGQVHHMRLEKLTEMSGLPDVQLVTARALAPLDELIGYAKPFLDRGATALFHKGESLEVELTNARKCWRIDGIRHSSVIDSQSAIFEVREVRRVGS